MARKKKPTRAQLAEAAKDQTVRAIADAIHEHLGRDGDGTTEFDVALALTALDAALAVRGTTHRVVYFDDLAGTTELARLRGVTKQRINRQLDDRVRPDVPGHAQLLMGPVWVLSECEAFFAQPPAKPGPRAREAAAAG